MQTGQFKSNVGLDVFIKKQYISENQSQESNQTELHLGASFLPHPVPPPVDCCEYHYTYCPSSNVDLNEADGTPAYDKPEGVPCLVPSNMIPHSPEGVKKCDGHLHGSATIWPDGSPIVCPEMSPIPVYPAHFRCPSMHQAYFSPVACVPNLQNTEEFWTQHGTSQCVPQSQTSSTDSEGQLVIVFLIYHLLCMSFCGLHVG